MRIILLSLAMIALTNCASPDAQRIGAAAFHAAVAEAVAIALEKDQRPSK